MCKKDVSVKLLCIQTVVCTSLQTLMDASTWKPHCCVMKRTKQSCYKFVALPLSCCRGAKIRCLWKTCWVKLQKRQQRCCKFYWSQNCVRNRQSHHSVTLSPKNNIYIKTYKYIYLLFFHIVLLDVWHRFLLVEVDMDSCGDYLSSCKLNLANWFHYSVNQHFKVRCHHQMALTDCIKSSLQSECHIPDAYKEKPVPWSVANLQEYLFFFSSPKHCVIVSR